MLRSSGAYVRGPGRRQEKSRPLLGGGSQRAPGLTMIRLYYPDGPQRIPQMSDFFAETKKYAIRRPPPNSRRIAHQPKLLTQCRNSGLRPIVAHNEPDAIHNSAQSPAPIGPGRRRGDDHILGYYVPVYADTRDHAGQSAEGPEPHRAPARKWRWAGAG